MTNARSVGGVAPRRRSMMFVGPKRWTHTVMRKHDGSLFRRRAERENPFDGLARHAKDDYRAGRTKSLRQFAEENDIRYDADR